MKFIIQITAFENQYNTPIIYGSFRCGFIAKSDLEPHHFTNLNELTPGAKMFSDELHNFLNIAFLEYGSKYQARANSIAFNLANVKQ